MVLVLGAIVWPGAAHSQEGDLPRVEYGAEGMRNPFKSYIVKSVQPQGAPVEAQPVVMGPFPTFAIQGVFWGAKFPQAIINDRIVKEGDVIDDAKILRITKDQITFLFANREVSVSTSAPDKTKSSESRKEAP